MNYKMMMVMCVGLTTFGCKAMNPSFLTEDQRNTLENSFHVSSLYMAQHYSSKEKPEPEIIEFTQTYPTERGHTEQRTYEINLNGTIASTIIKIVSQQQEEN